MTATRTLGSVVGVMLIGAAMGFDVLKVYGGGPAEGSSAFCMGGTGAQCFTLPLPLTPTQDTKDTCTGPNKVWGLNTGDVTTCAAAGGNLQDVYGISGYGGKWTPYFLTLGTLSALFAVAIIIYYLIYFRPYTSQFTVVGIITFLVGGVILEYFLMSQYHDTYDGPVSSATYFVIAVNTLVRLWVLLDVGCFEPQTTISGVLAAEAGKTMQKATSVITENVRNMGKELENIDMIYNRVSGLLGEAMAGKTPEEKEPVKSKLRTIFGKDQPKPATGGRSKRR